MVDPYVYPILFLQANIIKLVSGLISNSKPMFELFNSLNEIENQVH